jgi:hypothetical protein
VSFAGLLVRKLCLPADLVSGLGLSPSKSLLLFFEAVFVPPFNEGISSTFPMVLNLFKPKVLTFFSPFKTPGTINELLVKSLDCLLEVLDPDCSSLAI